MYLSISHTSSQGKHIWKHIWKKKSITRSHLSRNINWLINSASPIRRDIHIVLIKDVHSRGIRWLERYIHTCAYNNIKHWMHLNISKNLDDKENWFSCWFYFVRHRKNIYIEEIITGVYLNGNIRILWQ